ncbi:MAG: Stk1 family PASTA domain-containing Ser/Thr kinase [Acholeplasmataceae bacterium]|nr:Stk1 family PASTA domain-containing Ser/Thr kinase [Acholeplasmataceae bacterium]
MEQKIIGNRYQILESIGTGGMAEVYKAFDTFLNREVAVKILRAQYTDDEGFVSRFRQEAQSAARLIHPNIVNVYDVGRDDDSYYIIMEYVKGRTLKEFISEVGALDPMTAVIIAHGIASALKHAHSRGIIHCDIKPHNILLDENNNPKVADFGIARAITTATMTYTASVVGSVHYLSPEQVRGEKVSAQSDLYSLGILLFEMLTGCLPYTAETPVAVALMHVRERMPLVREINSEVPLVLEKIVAKALAKDKEERYSTADEFLQDLEYAADVLSGNIVYNEKDRVFIADNSPTVANTSLEETIRIDRTAYADQLPPHNEDDTDDKLERKKRIKRWLIGAVVAASFLIIGLFSFGVIGGPEVEVPDVTGKTVVEAQNILSQAKLGYTIDEEYNIKVAPGTVISQNPGAKRMVKEGRKITLVVSKGVELGDVPNLKGKRLTEAKAMLKASRFELGRVSYKYVSGAPEETILEQSVAPPAKLPIGTKLDVVINIKSNQVVLPDLVGLSSTSAKNKLNDLGLVLGKVNTVVSKEPDNTVIGMNPASKEVVNVGTVVDITVSKNVESTKPQQSQYVEFIVPAGSDHQEIKIVVIDDAGSRVVYNNTHKPGVRLRQQIEGTGNIRVQFYSNDKLVEERSL